MAKRNFKKLLDEALTKASRDEQIFIPGKIIEHPEKEIPKDEHSNLGTTINILKDSGAIDAYHNALSHALEKGDRTRLDWLLENEVEIQPAFLPLLLKAFKTRPPTGEESKLIIDDKIHLCRNMHIEARMEGMTHAKVFRKYAEKYNVDVKTIERWWDEVNIFLAPTPGTKIFNRRRKKTNSKKVHE